MPNSKGHRKGAEEKGRRGKMSKRASSFHGLGGGAMAEMLVRPRTVPDLLAGGRAMTASEGRSPGRLTKVLLNVTVQRSLGAVQVVVSPESTVGDVIAAAVRQYGKEERRPCLVSNDASGWGLHYSQFSLERLNQDEKVITLGSRNFFLCPRKPAPTTENGDISGGCTTTSCSNEVERPTNRIMLPWLKFF